MILTKEFLMGLVGLECDFRFKEKQFNEYDIIIHFKEISDEGLEDKA